MSRKSVPGWQDLSWGSRLLALPVWTYRMVISPWLPPACRYSPTCSEYALDALRLHGPVKGAVLAARRIGRCHPWGGQGYDPVPGSEFGPESGSGCGCGHDHDHSHGNGHKHNDLRGAVSSAHHPTNTAS